MMGKNRDTKLGKLTQKMNLSTCILIVVVCLFMYTCIKQKSTSDGVTSHKHSIKYSVITSYSFSIYSEHLKEMDYCILQNLMVKDLHVWVLLDHPTPTRQCEHLQEKLQGMSTNIKEWSDVYWDKFHCQYRVGKQPSYYDLVQYASTLPSEYVILSNGDIIFDDTINYAENLQAGQAYAISWSYVKQKPDWLGILDNHNRNVLRGAETKHSMCLPETDSLCSNEQTFFVINCWPKRLFSIDSFIARRETLTGIKDEGFTNIPHGDLDRNFTKKHYPMNWLGSEHAFVGALTHQRIDVFNVCKHIRTKHLHYAQQPDTAHRHVLYSEYGIYDTHHAEMWNKQLIFKGVANAEHYKLPLGI